MRSIISATTSATTPTRYLDVDGVRFSDPELGDAAGVPLVLLHFTATIDDWDPRVLDGIATARRVAFDNRGIGETAAASSGGAPNRRWTSAWSPNPSWSPRERTTGCSPAEPHSISRTGSPARS